MGHYHAEMHTDNRSSEQIKEEEKANKRRQQLEMKLCKLLNCKPKELKIVRDILQESWKR